MKTVAELLHSTGREVIAKNTLKHLADSGELISGIVAESHSQAREQLGADASADALARRTALLVLKRIGHIPHIPSKPEPEPQPVAEEQPGHFTQPAE